MNLRNHIPTILLQLARLARRRSTPGLLCAVLLLPLSTASMAATDAQRLTPTLASASIVPALPSHESGRSPCRTLECAFRHVDALTTVRLAGEFGRFTGRVTRWEADTLLAFAVDPEWAGTAPATPIAWSQVSSVDRRVNNAARGAVIGALSLGVVTALFAVTASSAANSSMVELLGSDARHKTSKAALTGGLVGGAVGAAVGAWVGSASNRWIVVYRR
jgi:hypothetical protein